MDKGSVWPHRPADGVRPTRTTPGVCRPRAEIPCLRPRPYRTGSRDDRTTFRGRLSSLLPTRLHLSHGACQAAGKGRGEPEGIIPRALLRPRVRVRDHAGLPPAARTPDVDG